MSTPNFPIYLTKEIQKVSAVAGVWTLTLSDVDGILVNTRVSVGGLVTPSWNAQNVAVTYVDQTAKTITYSHSNATVAETEAWGQLSVRCSWIALENLEAALGYEFEGDEIDWAECQVDAANDWAFTQRRNAGYKDHPQVCPGHQVGVGVVLYAQTLIRTRGAVDGFASFDQQSFSGVPGQSLGQIMSLLGVRRAQVG